MSIFQNTVVAKYLKGQNSEIITCKWNVYKEHFLNQKIQEDIRNLKEEQYQGEFLEDLFVKILGYTKPASSSETKFNLTTEYKNVKDSKKADGAIIIDEVVKAVIELKGTNTTDLAKVETQAFGYKNNQPNCTYVVTSNFEKLRFYIDNAIEHIEFNLFTLTEEEFKLLYLCLAYENIEKDIPKKIKEESVSEEDAITKKLYKDYSLFRRELHLSLVELNSQYDALTLFKKTQKLLDRFLFLFFAEDRHLLPPNSVRLILKQWEKLKELDAYTPLFDRFKKYFGYLNTGFKGKQYDVYAYNGGLFKADEVLDTITIDDNLLYKHTLTLSEYDFNSEVDVNILGHIFENSLTEIEEIQSKLEGQEIDKSKSKRKKDGVFYTPKYITKYIVENTVGKLCEEKKVDLKINEEDYTLDKKRQKKTRKALLDKLTDYRKWLLQLTICDPACGSGAFLNQALDYLITEHRYVDELQAKLFGDAMVLSDVENSILENNLFGVDINEESVEIAKLSLWLRTAQPNRKLNDLSNNIKCGNSLIDDVEVAGDKAFNWQQEFPQIFEKGGFDIVIGNPPYKAGRHWNDKNLKLHEYLTNHYNVAEYQLDLYILFFERAIKLLAKDSIMSFITPNTWLTNLSSKKLRIYLMKSINIDQIIDCSNINVFKDAVVETAIFCFRKGLTFEKESIISELNVNNEINNIHSINQSIWNDSKSSIININLKKEDLSIKKKIKSNTTLLLELATIKFGVKIYEIGKGTPAQTKEDTKNKIYESNLKIDNSYRKLLEGKDINRYNIFWNEKWLKYGSNLAAPRDAKLFINERILVRRIMGNRIIGSYIDNDMITNALLQIIKPNKPESTKFLLAIINSTLMAYFFRKSSGRDDQVFPEIKIHELRNLPIKNCTDHSLFIIKTDLMIKLNIELRLISSKFQRTLLRKFDLEKLSKKLENWYLLNFEDFIKELKKKKIKLSLSEEAEWENYFLQEQQKALEIKSKIDTTDAEIDQMVYDLYGLTEEEIEIVENS